MAVNWVDGVLGGTPITASNLNAMDLANPTSAAAIAASLAYESKGLSTATQATLSATYAPIGDLAYTSLDLAVAATPTGGVLEIRKAWSKSVPLTINKAMTLRFMGGSITQTTDTAGIDITSDNVIVENPVVTGVGGGTAGTSAAIRAVGTAVTPRTGIRVRGGVVDGWRKYGVYLEQVTDFEVSQVAVKNIAYGGIVVLSGIGGSVVRNKISNVIQPSGFVNSYGIALTRNSAQNITDAPRTSGVAVDGNTIDGVVNWEGIDTHGGQDLRIVNNRILNTNVGIGLVPCPDTGGTDTYAPIGIHVSGNYIDSTMTDGSRSQGIQLVGAGATPGSPVEPASAIITGNTILNHGVDSLAGGGAIVAYFTRGAVIVGNRMVVPAVCGIQLYHSNDGITVAGNTVTDVWTTATATAAAVYVRSTFNTVTVSMNTLSAGSKSATFVNRYGVQYASTTNNKFIDGGGNNFTIAATVLVGLTAIASMSFFGATPVLKQTGTAAAATDAATTQTLVNDLRTKLLALGLVS